MHHIDPFGIFTLAEVRLVFENHAAEWLKQTQAEFNLKGRGSLSLSFRDGRFQSAGYMERRQVQHIAAGRGFRWNWLELVDTYDPDTQFVVFIMYEVMGEDAPEHDVSCFRVAVQ